MKIIIVGAGKVGYALAEQLCRENHDVTIIDSSEDALRRACDTLDVMGHKGNGVNIPTLTEAGAADAYLLVEEQFLPTVAVWRWLKRTPMVTAPVISRPHLPTLALISLAFRIWMRRFNCV